MLLKYAEGSAVFVTVLLLFRHILSKDQEPPLQNVDRLVLHQASPTPSQSSLSEPHVPHPQKAHSLLQRPETSRGRPARNVEESTFKKQESREEEEPRISKEKTSMGKKEDCKMAENRETRFRERKESERGRRKAEKEPMLKEEEKRMHLLKEELAREEQTEERKLRVESEERLRYAVMAAVTSIQVRLHRSLSRKSSLWVFLCPGLCSSSSCPTGERRRRG